VLIDAPHSLRREIRTPALPVNQAHRSIMIAARIFFSLDIGAMTLFFGNGENFSR